MSNGTWVVQGTQYGLASQGTQSLGPFNIPFADVVDTYPVTLAESVWTDVPYNSTAKSGVWVIPPTTGTGGILVSGNSGGTGSFVLSPQSPSYFSFIGLSPGNSHLYLSASGENLACIIQFV